MTPFAFTTDAATSIPLVLIVENTHLAGDEASYVNVAVLVMRESRRADPRQLGERAGVPECDTTDLEHARAHTGRHRAYREAWGATWAQTRSLPARKPKLELPPRGGMKAGAHSQHQDDKTDALGGRLARPTSAESTDKREQP